MNLIKEPSNQGGIGLGLLGMIIFRVNYSCQHLPDFTGIFLLLHPH